MQRKSTVVTAGLHFILALQGQGEYVRLGELQEIFLEFIYNQSKLYKNSLKDPHAEMYIPQEYFKPKKGGRVVRVAW